MIFNMLIDFALAVIFLVALAFLLPLATEFSVRLLDLEFDWRAWIARAHLKPWPDSIPLLAMLVTTLVPTIIHLGAGIGAVVANFFGSYKRIADQIAAYENDGKSFHASRQQEIAGKIMAADIWYIPAFVLAGGFVGGAAWALFHFLAGFGLTLANLALWAGDLVRF